MPIGTKNQAIAGGGCHHVAVQARDLDASLKLYCDILGMEEFAEFGAPGHRIKLLDMGDGSYIELFSPTDQSPAAGAPAANDPYTHIALTTSDTHAATERVRAAGYEITVEPKTLDLTADLQVTIAFFKGPNGEVIEFFQTH
ncbi:MAG: VOC family protein [Candidatus Latescibacteria bacterium]|nr:VOC family protein [Candidatus Latescibacterota bacterium]